MGRFVKFDKNCQRFMIYILGQRLRELRKNSGFTLRKAAKEAGVDVAVLSKMERGERRFNKNLPQK